jgi:LmbE family N-acetylglucosaminyl deacetylase
LDVTGIIITKDYHTVDSARPVANRVLAIGAHPDDIEIGCGGTILHHLAQGDDVTILIITQGEAGGEPEDRLEEAQEAARLFECRLAIGSLPDTAVPAGRETIALIQQATQLVRPNIIYTHSLRDHHQDHRSVHHATLVASREIEQLFCYQSPSAQVDFSPTRFVPIDKVINRKIEIIRAHHSQAEVRDYLRPEYLKNTAAYWARFGTGEYCEAFETIRLVDSLGKGQ